MNRPTTILLLSFIAASFGTVAQSRGELQTVSTAESNVKVVEDPFRQLNEVDLYPNPAVDYLTVQISNMNLANVSFEIRSLLGSRMNVIAEDLGNGKYRFPVKEFSTGYYFVVVKDENRRFKKAFRFLKSQ